ncbi:MAG TPA: DUF6600 domain-containing protein [Bryobacteraceae bacterium]|nr:DUF6600 domain-containing protein [Bryobacteraceae bacterium]
MKNVSQILLALVAAIGIAAAQNDPPGRVGRLNYINGPVSLQPAGVDDWVEATLTRPITTGDHVWADAGARAEMHIGSATLRLGSRTAFQFLNLDDANTQIRLGEGSLNVHLRALNENETFEVDTPNLAFSLLRPGDYRIIVDPDNMMSVVTVRGGQGEVTSGNQAFTVRPGQEAHVTGDQTTTYELAAAAPPDDMDNWCYERDQREDRLPAARYVPRDMVGYEDLDDHGVWTENADYGAVWMPRGVPVGWSPYHYGHWAWIDPWGWTWIDDQPWGFAPFHYGRWAFIRGGWGWVPGPVAVRPVYAPALVAWVGGSRFSLSVGVGAGVAWFPLGPREVFVPAYRVSPVYVNRINNVTVVNNINITNVRYMNRSVPGAITAVPQGVLVRGESVGRSAVVMNEAQIRNAEVIHTAPFAPDRRAVYGGANAASFRPPAAVLNREVVVRHAPPPPPVSFAQRQQAYSANPGHPLDYGAMQNIRQQQGAASPRPMVRQAMTPGSGGRPQFNSPQQSNPTPTPNRTWQREGDRPPNRQPQLQQQQNRQESTPVQQPRYERQQQTQTPIPTQTPAQTPTQTQQPRYERPQQQQQQQQQTQTPTQQPRYERPQQQQQPQTQPPAQQPHYERPQQQQQQQAAPQHQAPPERHEASRPAEKPKENKETKEEKKKDR